MLFSGKSIDKGRKRLRFKEREREHEQQEEQGDGACWCKAIASTCLEAWEASQGPSPFYLDRRFLVPLSKLGGRGTSAL